MNDPENERSRLVVEFSVSQTAYIKRRAEDRGDSKADVLRDALTLLDRCERARADGLTPGAYGTIDGVPTRREFVYF